VVSLGIGEILVRRAQARVQNATLPTDPNAITPPPLPFEEFVNDAEKAKKLANFLDDPRWNFYVTDISERPVAAWKLEELTDVKACISDHRDIIAEIDGLAANLQSLPEQRLQLDLTKRNGKSTALLHALAYLKNLRVHDGQYELAEDYVLLLSTMTARMSETDLLSGSIGCRYAFQAAGDYLHTNEPSPNFPPRLKFAVERIPELVNALPEYMRLLLSRQKLNTKGLGHAAWNGALLGIPEVAYDSPLGLPVRRIDRAMSINSYLATIEQIEKSPIDTGQILNKLDSARTILTLPAMQVSRLDARIEAQIILQSQARINLLLTAIEMEAFRQFHNRYPASLNELQTLLPNDPFSNEPLVYSLSPLLLYSRGNNCVDDHGKEDDIKWRGFREET